MKSITYFSIHFADRILKGSDGRWCTTLGIAGLMDFIRRPVLKEVLNTTFWKWGLFSSSGERKETHALLDPLQRVNLNN
jgi:hypothetical protein